jgi:hypothetical protein
VLSDEQVHNFVEQLEVCRSLDDDKRVVLAAARLAQQREREAWVGALQTWLASRDVKVAICGGEQVAADLPSLLDDVFALLDAAEVRELRAALAKLAPAPGEGAQAGTVPASGVADASASVSCLPVQPAPDPETGLAACPFCGGAVIRDRVIDEFHSDIVCGGCDECFRMSDEAWNRRAALARPDAGGDGARRFAGLVLEYSRDNDFVDVDAGSIQDWALDCGLLEGVRVTEACGECCACAESDDFPQTCIRYSEAGIRVRSAARKGAEENGR